MSSTPKISHSVVIAKQEEPMEKVVQRMIDEAVSSILVVDEEENICGIITERDIVRKFTLLPKQNKLSAKAISFMTRPVSFVRSDSIEADVRKLYANQTVRHFPILMDDDPKLDNLMGILSASDFFRIWLEDNKKKDTKIESEESHVVLIMSHKISRAKYKNMLEAFSCKVHHEGSYSDLIDFAQKNKLVTIFDLDDDYGNEGARLITRVIATGGHVIFITNRLKLAGEFKKRLKNPKHHIMIKPLDIKFLKFLASESQKLKDRAS